MVEKTVQQVRPSGAIRGNWRLGLPLFLVACVYVLPLAGRLPATNPNETARIELAASIAFWARLDITPAAEVYGVSEDAALREGRLYSDKAPGLSLAGVPALWVIDAMLPREAATDLPSYWPVRHLLTLVLVALPTLGLAFLIAAMVPGATRRQRPALAVVAALATPLWTYATVFFGHAPAALMILIAWVLLLRPGTNELTPDRQRAVLGGVAAGLAFSAEYPTIVLVAIIFVVLVIRRTPLPILGLAAAAAMAGAIPALLYHDLAFGAPWLTGYTFKAHSDFQAIHTSGIMGISWPSVEGLWGVLFSARRGMIYYCPILLLTPLGLLWMVRSRGWRDAGPILIAAVSYVLFAAGFVDWTAGWCAAARHLVPILPLVVVVALFAATQLAERRWGALIVVVLISVSGVNAVLTIVLTPFFPPEFGAPLAQLVLPSLADGVGYSNVLTSALGITPSAVVALTLIIVVAALIWAAGRVIRVRAWWLPAVSLVTVTAVLLTYSWQGFAPTTETEYMRSQVLRRLGHTETANRIEVSSLPRAQPSADD